MALVMAAPAAAMQSAAPAGSAALQAAPASPPPTRGGPSIISNPDWLGLPSGDDLARLYPPAAARQRLSGHVRMRCTVKADGSLSNCAIVEECPAGLGFGEATLKSAAAFLMRPKTVDGAPVEGGVVIIPMTWQVAGGQPGPRSCDAAAPTSQSASSSPVAPDDAPAPQPSPDVIPAGQAAWTRTPTGGELAALYPPKAVPQGVSGRAVMACKVRKDGRLTDCTITEESPTGYGFGAATLAAAMFFKMAPTLRGAPVEGRTVVVPISWRLAP